MSRRVQRLRAAGGAVRPATSSAGAATRPAVRAAVMAAALAFFAACGAAPARPGPLAAPAPGTTTPTSTAPAPPTSPAPATTPATVAPATVAPATVAPAPAPPYPVGEQTLDLVDTSRPTVTGGRTVSPTRGLTTLVWFPQVAGRHPLVVFAHGFQVGPTPYESLLEAWAAHGYVVAAPEFPLTDQAVAGSDLDENDIDNQPADVRFVTDYLVSAADPLVARIDTSRVGVAGHSDGAETALAAAIAAAPAGQPAYRSALIMSGQPVTAGATTNPPVMVTQGDADTINPPGNGYQTYALAGSPKYLLVIHGGGHLPPLQPGTEWFAGVEAATEAFLDAYLAGDAPASGIAAAVAGSSLFALQSAP